MNAAIELLEDEVETLVGYLDSPAREQELPVLMKLVADYREALRVLQGWQPIESAPKDGSEIILATIGDSYAGFWNDKENYWGETGWLAESDRGPHNISEHPCQPTHWQPLPSPPEST